MTRDELKRKVEEADQELEQEKEQIAESLMECGPLAAIKLRAIIFAPNSDASGGTKEERMQIVQSLADLGLACVLQTANKKMIRKKSAESNYPRNPNERN